mmetsp:Transcript_1737/g.6114  ORF Transcript_1737/g.6114 Transcript_1737/m.6114 type:complete len:121 (-) Transcript_1737:26-388(-)
MRSPVLGLGAPPPPPVRSLLSPPSSLVASRAAAECDDDDEAAGVANLERRAASSLPCAVPHVAPPASQVVPNAAESAGARLPAFRDKDEPQATARVCHVTECMLIEARRGLLPYEATCGR